LAISSHSPELADADPLGSVGNVLPVRVESFGGWVRFYQRPRLKLS
jgi:hypothetical protein